MFDLVTLTGMLNIVLLIVAICATLSALARGNGSREARHLRRENNRLRNIVANLMIDKAQIRDMH